MIKVTNRVGIYEKEGRQVNFTDNHLEIRSHWNDSDRVVIVYQTPDGQVIDITVIAKDLLAAIVNAKNTARW